MTTSTQGKLGTYTSHQRSGEGSRETDARALLSCASRLKVAIDDGGADMKAYTEAVRHNQRLWTVFQIALCDPENALPKGLKMTLLNLSRYVDRVSFRAITQFAPQLLTSLININRTIAAGLTVRPPADAQGAAPAEQVAPPSATQAAVVMTSA